MFEFISVILPTYNPNISRLNETISGLKKQTLNVMQWELIIVDNNSTPAVDIDITWHPNHKVIIALNQGLTYARLMGFDQAAGRYIIMVDDDNILDKDYLANTLQIFKANPKLGAIGGKSKPLFETSPPEWLKEFYSNLALRDMGENILTTAWKNEYPSFAPIGAGMAIRQSALDVYISKINSTNTIITDRTANSLNSGGDNDIVLELLKSGWEIGYFPTLVLDHIIPKLRMEPCYMARLINNTNKSWVHVLEKHHINPWKKVAKWTVPIRKIKAWFTYRAWKNETNYIKWQGSCGLFDGLGSI
jgi:glycosyltransferase involved in cell wall biosynthesis